VLFANTNALDLANLKKYAAGLKLDSAQFDPCVESSKHTQAVNQDLAEGSRVGVSGTPAFFVNGRFLSGAQPFAAFQEAIEEALSTQ
jgi:protein-disulfide isomerase